MSFAALVATEDLTETLDRAYTAMVEASAEMLRAVGECDERRLWERDGATSMTSWLAARHALGWGSAREWVSWSPTTRSLPATPAWRTRWWSS